MKREVPIQATRLICGEVELASNGEGAKTAPFKMLARTGDPINHWFWGQLVHDMTGMVHKNRISIDYQHDPEQILGYANRIEIKDGDLLASGVIQSYAPGDRAGEVIFRGQAGQPYEASIQWDDDTVLEELPEGYTTEINNRMIVGPATIVKSWNLRGIAVTPHAYDGNTSTELSNGKMVELTINKNMENKIEVVEAVNPVETEDKLEASLNEAIAEVKEATEVLTAAIAEVEETVEETPVAEMEEVAVVEEEVPETEVETPEVVETEAVEISAEAEIVETHVEETPAPDVMAVESLSPDTTNEELEALRKENEELKSRLASLAVGDTPVSCSVESVTENFDSALVKKLKGRTSEALAQFAAGIKLPK